MASASNETPPQLAEFSDWFSPVFVKELRQGLRANYFVMPFIGAQVLAILAVGLEMISSHFGGAGALAGNIFLPFLSIVFSIAMPLTLFGSLQPEVSAGRNIELLLMSNLSRWQIVRGKLFVACSLSGLMMVSLFPYLLIRYFIGNVEVIENVMTVASLMFGNALMNAIVIGASGIKNYVGRVFMIGFVLISYSIVSLIMGTAVGGLSGLVALPVVSILYIILALQYGRAKLRLFENPIDPPSTVLIVLLIVLIPLLAGVAMAMLADLGGVWRVIGGVAMVSGLAVFFLLLDRGPGKKKPVTWAQP